MSAIAGRLIAAKVIPVIRTIDEASARLAVEVLSGHGFDVFEITLTTPRALEIIRDLSAEPSFCIGAGTVLTPGDGASAIDAGAGFVVSPAFVDGLAEVCSTADVAMVLGAATPTEALRAHLAGAAFVKVFPAAQLGGPGFVKALKSVYPQIRFMPTGGINPSDIAPYLGAGAVAVGMGGNLVSEAALKAGDIDVIRQAAADVRREIDGLDR
ncbi:MAG: bifunctional 4-hydroxy-2-oxoglutarate aldolase/2-dehydro-3-deoxy-phosphogluconate aldolase [Pseudomonadota bacterium]